MNRKNFTSHKRRHTQNESDTTTRNEGSMDLLMQYLDRITPDNELADAAEKAVEKRKTIRIGADRHNLPI